MHLLCMSHTCEVFDSGNISILVKHEVKLSLREKLLAQMPSLKPFLGQQKCVVIAALVALTKLVANDGHKSSIWEVCEHEVVSAGKTKKHRLFRERRFAQMGYTAGAILHHLDDYHASLQKTTSNEMLVQACRLYLECEYVLIGLKVLAWFTFCITLPFLNMTEVSTQKDLVSILPCLHDDLLEKKTNTLSQYRVPYSFQLDEPESPIELYLLGEMCTQAGKDLAKQRGREYGFSDASNNR